MSLEHCKKRHLSQHLLRNVCIFAYPSAAFFVSLPMIRPRSPTFQARTAALAPRDNDSSDASRYHSPYIQLYQSSQYHCQVQSTVSKDDSCLVAPVTENIATWFATPSRRSRKSSALATHLSLRRIMPSSHHLSVEYCSLRAGRGQ